MPTFEYQAERTDGSVERGVVLSQTLDAAARDLADKGLRVTRLGLAAGVGDPPVHAAGPGTVQAGNPYDVEVPSTPRSVLPPETAQRSYAASSIVGPLVGKVPVADLAFFFRQAATMLKAGVPIVQALSTLANQSRSPKLRVVLLELARNAEHGRPMSAVLQRYPEVFSPVMLSLLRAGEEGGFLDEALATIADYLDHEIELRNVYRKLTFWPKLELAFSVIVIVGANLIIDAIRPGAQHLESPLTTPATWIWLGPLIVAIFLFLRIGLANPRIKFNWDLMITSLPYLGKTMRQLAMARFGRAFGALYRAGVPMQKALTLAADACGNEYLRSRMYPAYRRLEGGSGITETLRSTGAFSPIVLDMVQTGETTGNVDQMLGRMSEFYIGEATVRQNQFAAVVGIVVALCVAIYIGYIIINFWLTYYSGIGGAAGG